MERYLIARCLSSKLPTWPRIEDAGPDPWRASGREWTPTIAAAGVDFVDRRRGIVADTAEDGQRISPPPNGERPVPEGVKQTAQTEQIGTVIDELAAGLLRGHVSSGVPVTRAALGNARIINRPRQSEIGDLDGYRLSALGHRPDRDRSRLSSSGRWPRADSR